MPHTTLPFPLFFSPTKLLNRHISRPFYPSNMIFRPHQKRMVPCFCHGNRRFITTTLIGFCNHLTVFTFFSNSSCRTMLFLFFSSFLLSFPLTSHLNQNCFLWDDYICFSFHIFNSHHLDQCLDMVLIPPVFILLIALKNTFSAFGDVSQVNVKSICFLFFEKCPLSCWFV